MASRRNWERRVWEHPLVHDFKWGFGLDIDDTSSLKNDTMVPLLFQDNALVDLELVKTNKENADWAVKGKPNTFAGSYIPKVTTTWTAWSPSAEIDVMKFSTMSIYSSMLNRLDAFDKKTGDDIETILELTHETTDEQVFPLWNGTKIYEGHSVLDYAADVPGLTGTQQPEGVAFEHEVFFDALHYYSNREMLRKMTGRMKNHYINGALNTDRKTFEKVVKGFDTFVPGMCKYQHPYTGCFLLFACPPAGRYDQMAKTGDVTAVEHLTVTGRTRFNEYNPDFNFART